MFVSSSFRLCHDYHVGSYKSRERQLNEDFAQAKQRALGQHRVQRNYDLVEVERIAELVEKFLRGVRVIAGVILV